MSSCEFIKAGLLTTVQDSGRHGVGYYAIPKSGVMDRHSAELANLIVGNDPSAPVIECNLSGPTITFQGNAIVALTGADMKWTINNEPVDRNRSIFINPGDILKASFAAAGLRAYIAIQGKIKSDIHFGSVASYNYASLGHNNGQAIPKGYHLEWEPVEKEVPNIKLGKQKTSLAIKIAKGPEYDLLTNDSQKLLATESFVVTPDSNRMGARLTGHKLQSTATHGNSVPVLPGFVQLLPSGQLIVILQDGQTTGGYPRIAYITGRDLDLFNQIAFNKSFKFTFGE